MISINLLVILVQMGPCEVTWGGKLVEDSAVQFVFVCQGVGRHGYGIRVDKIRQTAFQIVHSFGDTFWQTLEWRKSEGQLPRK